jgi:hypothetical protein
MYVDRGSPDMTVSISALNPKGKEFLRGFHVPYDQRDMIGIFNHFGSPLFRKN